MIPKSDPRMRSLAMYGDERVTIGGTPPQVTTNEERVMQLLAFGSATTDVLAERLRQERPIETSSVTLACRRLESRSMVKKERVPGGKKGKTLWTRIDA